MMLTIKSLALFAITSTLSTADVDARIGAKVDENNGQSRHLLPSEENLQLFHDAATPNYITEVSYKGGENWDVKVTYEWPQIVGDLVIGILPQESSDLDSFYQCKSASITGNFFFITELSESVQVAFGKGSCENFSLLSIQTVDFNPNRPDAAQLELIPTDARDTIAPTYRPTPAPTPKPECETKDVTAEFPFPIYKEETCAWVVKDTASNAINRCTSYNGQVQQHCPETCDEIGVGIAEGKRDVIGYFQILKGNFDCAYVAKGNEDRTRGECRKTSDNGKLWDQCPVTCGKVGEGSCSFLQSQNSLL